VRCARCGNENSEGNRFCGMCGAGLLVKGQAPSAAMPAPVEKVEKKAEPAAVGSSAEARLPARSANLGTSTDSSPMSAGPMITGPSFLGLNKPADGGRDSLGRPSRNLDYLLEDDEEKPRRGWGKLLMVVIALALLGGLGYLRWKQGGFDWVTQNKKPAAATESQGAADSGTSGSSTGGASGPSSDASSGAPGTSAPSSTPSAGGTSAAPAPDAAAPSAAGQDAGTANAAAAGGAAAGPSTPAENVAPPKPAADSAGDKAADADAGDATGAAAAAPPESTTAPPKKMRKPTPVTPVDATAEAERYIYGRGVPQDCDRGLHMLKPAAESNPKAMIALGTLYSTGTCTPRDLPTAYRWFAMALHKQPDNQPLQNDLQKLWGQMTQPERQLAIKLSQ
jgi:hypothetical protein